MKERKGKTQDVSAQDAGARDPNAGPGPACTCGAGENGEHFSGCPAYVQGSHPAFEVVEFESGAQKNHEEFKKVVMEHFDDMKDAILTWKDAEGDAWYVSKEMPVSQAVGLLEIAKHWLIDNYED